MNIKPKKMREYIKEVTGPNGLRKLQCSVHKNYKGIRKTRVQCFECICIYNTRQKLFRQDCWLYDTKTGLCVDNNVCVPSDFCNHVLDKE